MRIVTVLPAIVFVGCAGARDTEVPDVPSNANEIDAYLGSLPYLPAEAPAVSTGPTGDALRTGDYQCTKQNYVETRDIDRIVAYTANSNALFPGALLTADSVVSGLFTQVALPRAPATISVSLENLGGGKSAVVEAPSLSAYRDALGSILDAEITGSTPANLYSEIEQVHSARQLDLALGINAGWGLGLADLKASFDFQSQQTRSRYLVRYTQAYYTVDVDAPEAPSAVFGPDVTVGDVAERFDASHPPVYVSSVTYGRMVVFTFESEYSAEEMGAALEFAYGGGFDVSGEVSVTYKDMISSSKITAFILGGDAGSAAQTIDSYEALVAFIKSGGNYSRQSPGAPIAYKLAYLQDNAPARMSSTTDYDVLDCVRVSQRVRIALESIAVDDDGGDGGSDLEIYGTLGATATANTATLFSKGSGSAVVIRTGSQFQPGTEAILSVRPQAGQSLLIHGNLRESDTIDDDSLGNESMTLPFELGWRRKVTLTFTGSDARVRATFSLTPI